MNLEGKFSNFKRNIRRTIAALSLSAFLYGCPFPTDPIPQPPVALQPQAAENVNVFSDYTSQQISSVNENSITLYEATSETDSLSVGDIIICGITPATPNGLLRKVSDISPDRKTINTTSAAIEEIVDNYSFEFSQQLEPSQIRSVNLEKGITPSRNINSRGIGFFYDIDNVVLYDFDSIPGNGNEIVANGDFSLTPNFKFNIDIKHFKLNSLIFKIGLNENLNIEATSPAFLLSIDKTINLADYHFAPIVFTIPTIPPIPVVITPEIEVGLNLKGSLSKLSTKLGQDATLNIGVSYSEGSWSPVLEFTKNFNYDTPEFSKDIEFCLSANAGLSASLYGCIGAYAEATGYLTFESWMENVRHWQLIGGIMGNIGLEAKVFSYTIAKYERTILDYSEVLLQGQEEETPIPPVIPEPIEEVLFASNRSGNYEIYKINSDRSGIQNLTNNSANDSFPRWSPDRNRIVFVSDRNGNFDVYLMDSNGQNQKQITYNSSASPSWSINNELIFNSGYTIFLMPNPLGSLNYMSRLGGSGHECYEPSWSPDGKAVVYSRTIDTNWEIYKVLDIHSDLTETRLTSSGGHKVSFSPSWSPDGAKIAYVSDKNQEGNYDIYVMNADGSNQQRLTSNLDIDSSPVWSKTGSKIFFQSERDGNNEIYTMNADGSNQQRLTDNTSDDILR